MFVFSNLPNDCGCRPAVPASYSETNTVDHKTWKLRELLAHLPKHILSTNGNSNSGPCCSYSAASPLFVHVILCACRPLRSSLDWWCLRWWWVRWGQEPRWSPSVTASPPFLLGWSTDSHCKCLVLMTTFTRWWTAACTSICSSY